MRRFLVAAVPLFVIVAMLAPPVLAQTPAPAPKVTITGLFDQITGMGKNFYDGDYTRAGDHEWYARTRFRPDFTFEVGRVKAVLGLELDLTYGQVRPVGGGPGKGGTAGGSGGTTGDNSGSTSELSVNTDTAGIIEIKWIYTEFPLTGKDSLMPFIPVDTMARLGGQPFASLAQLREYALYAGGDFAGFSSITQFNPDFNLKLAYVMVEDELANYSKGQPIAATNPNYANVKVNRGNDFAVIVSPEWTATKGLTFKPMYSYFMADGVTNGNARRTAVDRNIAGTLTNGGAAFGGQTVGYQASNGSPSMHESRNTIGLETAWRAGAFGLFPVLYFQWGAREYVANVNSNGNAFTQRTVNTEMSSFLFDTVVSYQLGPLLLEARGVYSPGNKAHDNLSKGIHYFEPLDEDNSYYTGWAMMLAGSPIDYFEGTNNSGDGSMSSNVGYDRYGRAQLGIRATYSLTPAWSFWTMLNPTWTAQKVDTKTGVAASSGSSGSGNRVIINDQSFTKGDSNYIGTEMDLGMTWRFAPNAAFDIGAGYLFAGAALKTTQCNGSTVTLASGENTCTGTTSQRDQHDAYTAQARVRLSF